MPYSGFVALSWRRPGLAALPGHQRAQQPLAVDRIRLGAPMASGHGNFRFPPYPEVRSTPILPEGKQPKCPAYGNHNQKARCLQADSDTRKSMLAGPRAEEVGFAHDSALEEAVLSELVSESQIPC